MSHTKWKVIPEVAQRKALSRYHVDENGCWITGYAVSASTGYAQVKWYLYKIGRRSYYGKTNVHRAAYVARFGQIPGDMLVDHICKVKRCVNPDHLRLLTLTMNSSRGNRDAPLDRCLNGHEFEPNRVRRVDNSRADGTTTACILCRRQHERDRYRRLREAAGFTYTPRPNARKL